jgi:adenylate cyclase
MNRLLSELRRRNVFRVAGAYLIVGWLVMQVVSVMTPALAMPDWVDSFFAILLILGFPIALLLAWAFEMTPEGMKLTTGVVDGERGEQQVARAIDYAIFGGLVLVVALMIGSQFLLPRGAPADPASPVVEVGQSAPASTAPDQRSVAVLPFITMSTNEDDRFFSDGLTEEILNALAALPDLLVTSRTSAFQFRGDDIPSIPEIADQLGVAHVMEGSVRRSGDQVRITVQLIRAADDAHLWSGTYDRTLDDVFGIQEDIAENVANLMGVVLDESLRARLQRSGSRNIDAFIAYQRGFDIFTRLHHVDSRRLIEAEPYFERATSLEPALTPAYLYQADYYAHQMYRLLTDPASFDREAFDIAAAENARLITAAIDTAIDPDQRTLAAANQMVFADEWSNAQAVLDAVFAQTTCIGSTWADSLAIVGSRIDEMIERADLILRCDPLDLTYRAGVAEILIISGDLPRAEQEIEILAANDYPHERLRVWLDSANTATAAEYAEIFPGAASAQTLLRAAARRADRETVDRLARPVLTDENLNLAQRLSIAAQIGDRTRANALAAEIDARPMSGYIFLFSLIDCACGAPFDLDATPNFAARMSEAGFAWPPQGDLDWPLKTW